MNTRHKATLLSLVFAASLLALPSVQAADLTVHSDYFKKHRRMASLETVVYQPECRVGWWQTIRAGHVRPLWATRCR